MSWEVEGTDEFRNWFLNLTEKEADSMAVAIDLLELSGPSLGFPYSSRIIGSRYNQMRELRIQHAGKPYRILYAFDPTRTAILLVGGCKRGNDRWYEQFIPRADRLFSIHLSELEDK